MHPKQAAARTTVAAPLLPARYVLHREKCMTIPRLESATCSLTNPVILKCDSAWITRRAKHQAKGMLQPVVTMHSQTSGCHMEA